MDKNVTKEGLLKLKDSKPVPITAHSHEIIIPCVYTETINKVLKEKGIFPYSNPKIDIKEFELDKDMVLDCSTKNLTELYIGDKRIKALWCDFNKLTRLNVQGLTNLTELSVDKSCVI